METYKIQRRKKDERYEQAFSFAICHREKVLLVATRSEFGFEKENVYVYGISNSLKVIYRGVRNVHSGVVRSCFYGVTFLDSYFKGYPIVYGIELDNSDSPNRFRLSNTSIEIQNCFRDWNQTQKLGGVY